MAGEITPAPARRRIAADLIDAALVTALTAPISIPVLRRVWREMKAEREQRPGNDFDPDSVRPPIRSQVLTWMFKPRKPWYRTWNEWTLFAVSNAYAYGLLVLHGQTIGQRALGLRTVRSSDGGQPGWDLLARWGGMTILNKSLPTGLAFASLPVRFVWMVTHPQRPWQHLVLGIVVIEDSPPTRH
jgi:hypothetical protein